MWTDDYKVMIVKANSLQMRLECLIRRVTVAEKDAFRRNDVRAVTVLFKRKS